VYGKIGTGEEMSFYLYLGAGALGGLLGGMGMGGGTVLIPLLTLLLGVEQRVAQLTNLLAFLPMACVSLWIHQKNGLVQKDNLLLLMITAGVSAVLGSVLAFAVTAEVLKKLFGAFLLLLAVVRAGSVLTHRN
jgi:hypothetical protein